MWRASPAGRESTPRRCRASWRRRLGKAAGHAPALEQDEITMWPASATGDAWVPAQSRSPNRVGPVGQCTRRCRRRRGPRGRRSPSRPGQAIAPACKKSASAKVGTCCERKSDARRGRVAAGAVAQDAAADNWASTSSAGRADGRGPGQAAPAPPDRNSRTVDTSQFAIRSGGEEEMVAEVEARPGWRQPSGGIGEGMVVGVP